MEFAEERESLCRLLGMQSLIKKQSALKYDY